MSTKAELLALAERVEAGNGIDRSLDVEIYWICMCSNNPQYREREGFREVNSGLYSQSEDWRPYSDVFTPMLSGSVDAVEVLRTRVLPASVISSGQMETIWLANLWPTKYSTVLQGKASIEPRARLAAVLRALADGVE